MDQHDFSRTRISDISTRWAVLADPAQFTLRYGPAIYAYLGALLKDRDAAEEVSQEVFLKVVQGGFANLSPERGRFRDYLKVAVRNTAITYLRRKSPLLLDDRALEQIPDHRERLDAADQVWLADWRSCVLNKAWRLLEHHERRFPGSLYHTVLRLAVDHPGEDSSQLAGRASQAVGRALRPEAFRKQLSRARRMFARYLVAEICLTLEQPTAEEIQEELLDLGLMPYVADLLPSDLTAPDRATPAAEPPEGEPL
ncbi:hypothetical protein AYO44_12540 [Planctomycetaceae bacterium SCGC AG-212-F19]|nr:hypothetical protein AYO44_12540 [Planctomycetaceae bacterium SCGC AG-212-F19]